MCLYRSRRPRPWHVGHLYRPKWTSASVSAVRPGHILQSYNTVLILLQACNIPLFYLELLQSHLKYYFRLVISPNFKFLRLFLVYPNMGYETTLSGPAGSHPEKHADTAELSNPAPPSELIDTGNHNGAFSVDCTSHRNIHGWKVSNIRKRHISSNRRTWVC